MNILKVAEGLTKRGLAHLVNNLTFTRNIYTDFDNNHFGNTSPKEGDTLEVRLPNYFKTTSGSTYDPQNINDRVIPIVLSEWEQVSADFTDQDLTLKIDDFADKFLDGAMIALKEKIDFVGLGEYKNVYNQVGTPGTTPASTAVIGDAGQVLDDNGVPRDGKRTAIVNPAANNKLLASMGSLFNPSSTISRQFTTGALQGVALDFKWAMDQNVNVHTTGNFGTTGAVIEDYNVSGNFWMIDFSNDGDTPKPDLKHGDVFTIDGVYSVNPRSKQTTGKLQQIVLTKDYEWIPAHPGIYIDSMSPKLIFDENDPLQNVTGTVPGNGSVITFSGEANKSYPVNLLFHKNAFAFVSSALQMPFGNSFSSRQSYEGVNIRLWRDSVFTSSTFPTRLDMLFGFKTIRPEMAVRLIG